jgi:hypothetical protein
MPQLAVLVLEVTSHPTLFAFSELYAHPTPSKVRAAGAATRTRQEETVEVKVECWSAPTVGPFLPSTPLVRSRCLPLPPIDPSCDLDFESCLEGGGVNRQNLKFTHFKSN